MAKNKTVKKPFTPAPKPKKRKVGRPLKYSTALADLICNTLIKGVSICTMCKAEGMPNASTVFYWLNKYPEFLDKYTRAKQVQAHVFEEQAISIADDDSLDEVFTDEGKRMLNVEFVQRSKLRVETRKWAAKVNHPKKYGDKISQELSGPNGGPVTALILDFGKDDNAGD